MKCLLSRLSLSRITSASFPREFNKNVNLCPSLCAYEKHDYSLFWKLFVNLYLESQKSEHWDTVSSNCLLVPSWATRRHKETRPTPPRPVVPRWARDTCKPPPFVPLTLRTTFEEDPRGEEGHSGAKGMRSGMSTHLFPLFPTPSVSPNSLIALHDFSLYACSFHLSIEAQH